MPRSVPWPALFASALLAPALLGGSNMAAAAEPFSVPHSATIIGPTNPLLTAGSEALEVRRYEEGVRLTLAGLEQPNSS